MRCSRIYVALLTIRLPTAYCQCVFTAIVCNWWVSAVLHQQLDAIASSTAFTCGPTKAFCWSENGRVLHCEQKTSDTFFRICVTGLCRRQSQREISQRRCCSGGMQHGLASSESATALMSAPCFTKVFIISSLATSAARHRGVIFCFQTVSE